MKNSYFSRLIQKVLSKKKSKWNKHHVKLNLLNLEERVIPAIDLTGINGSVASLIGSNGNYVLDSQANSAYQDIISTKLNISDGSLTFSLTATAAENQNLAITGISVASEPRYDIASASSGLAVNPALRLSMGQAAAEVLASAGAQAERLVADFLARPDAREQIFNLFNGGKAAPDAAWNGAFDKLIADLQSGQSNLRIEMRSQAELGGAYGAYSATGTTGQPTIFLNADWASSVPDAKAITSVLVEEIGHAIDARLNGSADTAGDEGAIFSAKVCGLSLESSTLQAMAGENDSGTLRLDGQNLTVEFSVYDANTADTDGDGVFDANDLDDDNDGILDTEEQRVTGAAPITPDSISFKFAQNTAGYSSTHDAASVFKTGDSNDPAFLFDGNPLTELRVHSSDVYEFGLPRTLSAGASFSLAEAGGSNDAKMAVLGSFGTTDANGNLNNATGGGQGWNTIVARFNGMVVGGSARTVSTATDLETLFIANGNQPLVSTDGKSILLYAGLSDATKTFTSSISINHFQLIGLGSHGGWADLAVTSEVNPGMDTDSDGTPNSRDLDSDNDGISDLYEAVRSNSDDLAVIIDTNLDGTITLSEVTTYNTANSTTYGLSAQGVWSFFGNPSTVNDGNQPADSDNDGVRDFLDLDSDNDGTPDTVEARPSTNFKTNDGNVSNNDTDGDGVIDIFDSVNGFGGSFATPINSDGNGDSASFDNMGKPTSATVDTGVDNVTPSDIKAAQTAGDGKYAKLKETSDVWVVDMGQTLPPGAIVTIVAQERGSINDKLYIQQSDNTGAVSGIRLDWQPTKKDTYETFTYTITAGSRYLKFTTSNSREFRVDAISWGYGNLSTAPVPDYIDTDSDNDGNLDKFESGLTRTGVDANKDGIDDGINASYPDPDGVVAPSTSVTNYNLTTSGTLTNNDGTPADVDYRSLAAQGSLTVSNLEVNERSPYATFVINGAQANTSVKLSLVNDGDPSTADATLATDTTNALQYSTNGTTWTNYIANSTITVGTGGLLVRVGINNDNPAVYEGPEGFRLQVKYDIGTTSNSTFSLTASGGYGLILDDGTGDYWSGNTNISADPDATPPTLDNDSPIIIDDVVVNESSQFGAVFTLNTSEGSVLNLSLATTNSIAPIGNAILGTDTSTPLQYSVDDGATWVNYTWNGFTGNRPTAPVSGTVYVRVPITDDAIFEGRETFKLVATRDNNGITIPSVGGLGTIRDDGLGSFWLNNSTTPATEAQLATAGLSLGNDTPIFITNPVVNEGSGWIVFELEGQANQLYTPSLVATQGAGYASPTSDFSTTIQYWNGTAWVTYTSGTIPLEPSGHGHIRVGIVNDSPAVFEGPETFKLVATATNSVVSTGGIGTIRDDGLGTKYSFSGTNDGTINEITGPGAGFDDDSVQQNTPPTFGPIDITSGTDSGLNDNITNNGNPVITFTGDTGLTISLVGADGVTLLTLGSQYSVVETSNGNGTSTYTVTLLDANGNPADGNQPFGTYLTTSPNIGTSTNNADSVADGFYTIKATNASGNQATVGTFVIDTTAPGTSPLPFGPLDITTPTDSGVDDTITNNAHPVIEFTGEAGLTINLYGPDGTLLALGTQYTVNYANGKYSVTLIDAIPGNGNAADPFGTYFNGTATNNNPSTADGIYTIKATDVAGNQSTVGDFVIDTTKPGQSPAQSLGAIDITPGTDTGANDTTTADGNPVIEFTGEAGLDISLFGPGGTALLDGVHYTVSYDNGTGKYSVKLLDANPNLAGFQPFGDYDANGVATNNGTNVADGIYTIKATDVAGNQATVGTFVIDTAPNAAVPPTFGPLDITTPTDTGADDTTTANGLPVINFTGTPGLTNITLQGADGLPLAPSQYSVTETSPGNYSVALLDADTGTAGAQPFGTYLPNGNPTNNPGNSSDGLYTILSGSIPVGTFVIDTTPPGLAPSTFGPLDITTPTDSGADDNTTNNGNPVLTFTGEAGLIIQLFGPADNTTPLNQSQYTVVSTPNADGSYTYTVTLVDGNTSVAGNGPFGTYNNGSPTNNPANSADGTYTIRAMDLAGNKADVGQFVIDTTVPGQAPAQPLGPIDITPGTDSGDNDNITNNGNPVITFTGEPGLTISLLGSDGTTTLLPGIHYTVAYNNGTYSVTLLDADPNTPGSQPFGTYSNGNPTNNGNSTKDGTYTIKATDTAGNQAPVGSFVIDTTPPGISPGLGALDITPATDTGTNDTTTANGNPVVEFTGPAGLSVNLYGPDGTLLALNTQYTVDYANGKYSVTLLDAIPGGSSNPYGDYNSNGTATGNSASVGDGYYTIEAVDVAGNPSTVGNFLIDTTPPATAPGLGNLNITTPTDSGADDTTTNNGNPVLEFTGEPGLQVTLFGPDGTQLVQGTQYTVAYSNGTYSVTLLDAIPGGSANPFGTYNNGSPTNNTASTADGLYTIKVSDTAGNQSTVGTFVIDTTLPGTQPNPFGPLDIIAPTDSGVDDTITNNAHPVIEFTGEAGLTINLYGPDGTLLALGTQYTVSYANGKYTVTLIDAIPGNGNAADPFGTYFNGTATNNNFSTSDGTYTIKATDVAGNQATVGDFVIDTTKPGQSPALALGAIDITPGTDTGSDDTTTADGNPVIEFTGEPGLDISLFGPGGTALLDGVHFTVSYDNNTGKYSVKLLDADPTNPGFQPFGTYDASGIATNNGNNTKDGTYTIKATDVAGNQATVGTFDIITTPASILRPNFGPLDITPGTDTGADDTTTANGLPVITFTGPSGLSIGDITLQGVDGTTLAPGQYSVSSNTSNGITTYTVTLLDADTGIANPQPFGTYNTTSPYAETGNPTNTGDGLYTIIYTHQSVVTTVGTFVIDTTRPGIAPNNFGPLDISTPTDSGANDTTTNNGNPVLEFIGEAGLTIKLFGPTDNVNPLDQSQYTVVSTPNADGSYTYTVTLVDGNPSVAGNGPFGTYNNGSPTGNPTNSADGTYTILALDRAGNKADVGQFVIDTTAPGQAPAQALGQIDITPGTDSGDNDNITNNGNPVITFTGEPGLTISLLGSDGTTPLVLGTQYTVAYSNGTYSVTLLDADPSTPGNQPFGTYSNGNPTNNGNSTKDGTYTIKATDTAGNQATVGSFVIDTAPPGISPGLGALDITPATDTAANDTTTANGNPVIEFTGEPGLAISLLGPDGTTLAQGTQYTVSYANGKYTVTLLDAIPGGSANPFGDYNTNGTATGNSASVGDGFYTIKATDVAGNQSTVGNFLIDTAPPATSPGLSPLDITTPTDSGADDSITNQGNPILEFQGEPGLQVSLLGPDGTPLVQGSQYTVAYSNGTYTVNLRDAVLGGSANPFGTNSNGSPTGNPDSTADGLYTIKAIDTAGNESTVGTFTIDTTAPTVVVTSSVPKLAPNQTATITFTFNEVPVGFIAGDIVATGGAISNLAVTADPKVYTATFTRAASGNTNCSVTVPAASYTDAATNPGTAGATTISIDTQGPSLVISSDKPNLEYRQTAIITFTFSETPTGFDSGDVNLAGGTLSNLRVDPTNPMVYTALFTPTIDFVGNGLISVANGTFTDSFGNLGTGASINPAISIFNRIRGFSATGDNSSNVGQNIGNANTGSGTSVVLYNPVTGESNGNVVPFPGFMGEVRVSRADTNGDGILDMIVSPGNGGGPIVKVIDSATGRTLNQFMAYDPGFTGGIFVSVCDFNNDGFSEIITGAGAGGGPHVKVFDGRTHGEIGSFFAYAPSFTGGVSVATFDFDRDGILDIVTGAGAGGSPHVKVYNGATLGVIKEFMAYTVNFTGGVYVAAGDFLSDGRYEIITGAGAGGGPHIKVWDYETLNLVSEKMAYDNFTFPTGLVVDMLFSGGVRVGLADGNDDGIMDVIAGAGPGGGPHVKVLAGRSLDVIRNFFSGEITDSRGVFVGS